MASSSPSSPYGSVINLNDFADGDKVKWSKEANRVYIGRKSDLLPKSEWFNPNRPDKAKKDGLEVCLQQYKEHILLNSHLMDKLPTLKGKTLGCYCKPNKCHGDILVELRNLSKEELIELRNKLIESKPEVVPPPSKPEVVPPPIANPPSVNAVGNDDDDDDDDDDDYDYHSSDNYSSNEESVTSVDTLYDEIQLDSLENLSECATNLIFKVNQLILVNNNLKKKLSALEKKNNDVSDKLYENEIYTVKQDQYIRRNNFELCGVSEKISDRNLERYADEKY